MGYFCKSLRAEIGLSILIGGPYSPMGSPKNMFFVIFVKSQFLKSKCAKNTFLAITFLIIELERFAIQFWKWERLPLMMAASDLKYHDFLNSLFYMGGVEIENFQKHFCSVGPKHSYSAGIVLVCQFKASCRKWSNFDNFELQNAENRLISMGNRISTFKI